MTSIFDSIVVGSGVSGMTAALYLKRAGKNVLLLEKSAPGGQINMSPAVENYPGFKNIEGAILASNIFEQIQSLDVEYKYGDVLSIKKLENLFSIKTDIEEYLSKTVIVATGRKIEKLNLESEEQLIGKGISYCALCDGNFFKDADVCLVGNDYRSLEEAQYLANIVKNLFIICDKKAFDGAEILVEKLNHFKNIKIYYNSIVSKLIIENNQLKAIKIKNENLEDEINCSGLFISNNNVPQLDFEHQIKTINNYIEVDEKMQTNITGIFACGDVIKKDIYQLTTAIGEATIAASSALKYLTGR